MINYFVCYILITVYQYDFVRSDKGVHCSTRSDKVLKEFIFPTYVFSTSSKALMGCEKYCSNIYNCWGCSVHCSTIGNCQWNAITDCGEKRNWTGLTEGDVSQKPSMLNEIDNFTMSFKESDNFLTLTTEIFRLLIILNSLYGYLRFNEV